MTRCFSQVSKHYKGENLASLKLHETFPGDNLLTKLMSLASRSNHASRRFSALATSPAAFRRLFGGWQSTVQKKKRLGAATSSSSGAGRPGGLYRLPRYL